MEREGREREREGGGGILVLLFIVLSSLCCDRGHSPEYYNHSLGPHLASSTLIMLRDSFREPEYMETPV